jgi:hypothetical protein
MTAHIETPRSPSNDGILCTFGFNVIIYYAPQTALGLELTTNQIRFGEQLDRGREGGKVPAPVRVT